MTKQEREYLNLLVERVRKSTDLIHTLPGRDVLEDLEELSPIEIMQEVISHLNTYDIYLRYARFDQEASVRDLDKLCKIISSLGGKSI